MWLFLVVLFPLVSPKTGLDMFLSSPLSASGDGGLHLCLLEESYSSGFSIPFADCPSHPLTELVPSGWALRPGLQPQERCQRGINTPGFLPWVQLLTRWS